MTFTFRLSVLLICILGIPAVAQDIPGSTSKTDAASLRTASRAQPDNVGLRLRYTQALLRDSRGETHPDKTAAVAAEIQTEWKACVAANPAAVIPLRAMARDAYYARDFDSAIAMGRQALLADPTDAEMATIVVKALVRTRKESEAIDVLIDNFRRQGMPAFAQSQGLISALVTNTKLRELLDAGLSKLVEERPKATLIRLAYAGFLSEVGRYQDAWREFHRAERDGLCDTGSGGRHPFGAVLRDKAPEPEFPGAFAGVDLAGLEKEAADHPDHCGIAVRLARRYELPVTEKLEAAALTVVLDDTQRRAIEKAVAGYGVALTHNPECWPALFRTGELLLILDKPAEAATFLDKAANAFPVYVPAWLDLAVAWARAGDPKRAGEALAAFGARTDVLKGTTQFLEASRFSAPDSFKAVADVLADAAARVPNNALLPAHLALVRFRAGDIEGARSAALLAEKNGLVGRNALPHPALLEVHGIKVPVAASSDR